MRLRLRDLDGALQRAENAIALLDRCRPRNLTAVFEQLCCDWKRGDRRAPRLEYPRTRPPSGLCDALERLEAAAVRAGPWGALYAERARELIREARIAETLPGPDARVWAAQRFAVSADVHAARAETWSRQWCQDAPDPPSDLRCASDDDRDPGSLISVLGRMLGAERLAFRVDAIAELASVAATGDGVILVRAGWRGRPRDVKRVAVHEVYGHALPRHRARGARFGLYRTGTAGGSDDEEGRALLLERRAGLMDAHRRAELGRRHLAAVSVGQGASFVETGELLLAMGTPLEEALRITARVHRGGGLAREIVYLPALSRVRTALAEEPELERWLERGRIGVEAARRLARLGDPPDELAVLDAA